MKVVRKLFGFLALLGAALGAVVVYRRRFAKRRERVDLYYEDGSLLSLEDGSPGAERLLPLAPRMSLSLSTAIRSPRSTSSSAPSLFICPRKRPLRAKPCLMNSSTEEVCCTAAKEKIGNAWEGCSPCSAGDRSAACSA